MSKPFSADDVVCFACFEDQVLSDIIRLQGEPETCCLCARVNPGMSIRELAQLMYPVIEEHYVQGPQGFNGQEGDDLSWVVQEVLEQHLECEECLIKALCEADPADPRDGDTPLIEEWANYRNKRIDLSSHYERWECIKSDLKHRRRFFNDSAKEYFDSLFDDLELTRAHNETNWSAGAAPVEVITGLPAGATVFRGRLCDTEQALTRFVKDPSMELGAPPAPAATAGRMNPEGISVFYGALEDQTCLAELRPSIGGMVLVGQFATTSALRVLDFRLLEKSFLNTPLSYFQPDAGEQFSRRAFLQRLHRLIAEPVLPDRESDYLITQYLAEYLSHVRKPGLDGLIFKSTQRAGGANIVLFPSASARHVSEDTSPPQCSFPVKCIASPPALFRAQAIEYTTEKVDYSVDKQGARLRFEYDVDDV